MTKSERRLLISSFVIRHSSFVIRHSSFVIRHSAPAESYSIHLRAMRLPTLRLLLLAAALSGASPSRAESPLENGSFDDPAEPLKGWITDYEWTGNSWYVGNKKQVSIVAEGERGNVVKLTSPGDAGV